MDNNRRANKEEDDEVRFFDFIERFINLQHLFVPCLGRYTLWAKELFVVGCLGSDEFFVIGNKFGESLNPCLSFKCDIAVTEFLPGEMKMDIL